MRFKVISLFSVLLAAWPGPGRAEEKKLSIVVLEGEGAFNDIKHKIARSPIVEVRDEDGRPVAGAEVVFTLPEIGPSGSFAGGSKKFSAMTDAQGHVGASAMKPNTIEGRFNIKVTAQSPGRSGSVIISQSNTLAGGVVRAEKGGSSKKKIAIAILLAGGAGGGIFAATHRGGGAPAAPGPVPTTLSAGSVSVGGPR